MNDAHRFSTLVRPLLLFLLLSSIAIFVSIPPVFFLLTGIVVSSIARIKTQDFQSFPKSVLNLAIILMGFGLPITQVIELGVDFFPITLISITCTIAVGLLIAKFLKVDFVLGVLITCGTAICGGSAIAAVSGSIHAKNESISRATLIIFLLNGVALLVFPLLGHWLSMDQHSFGEWAALAIHDTSSVIGSAEAYGNEALHVATTAKLVRSLWIFPVSLVFGLVCKSTETHRKIPWFIIGFVAAAILNQQVPAGQMLWAILNGLGKNLIGVALFFVGLETPLSRILETGMRPLIMAVFLWITVCVASAVFVLQ